jgi:hypothetical protein
MSGSLIDEVVNAVLYEGYILYPYRPSARKNQQRFTFGRVYPQAYSVAQEGAEPCLMQTQCLWRAAAPDSAVEVSVCFLHPAWREVGLYTPDGQPFRAVPELRVDGKLFQSWQEAVEQRVNLPAQTVSTLAGEGLSVPFTFPAARTTETIRDAQGQPAATIVRRQEALAGLVEVRVEPAGGDVFQITARVLNRTPLEGVEAENPDAILMRVFASTHTILQVREPGEFLSLLDPPAEYQEAAAACRNIGVWPVLVGDEAKHERTTMLASPIILYDYPKIAPQSAGDLCDGGEIDEILTLRIKTLTDDEKGEMREVDDFARRILERTEALPDERLLAMHGAMRETVPAPDPFLAEDFFNPTHRLESVALGGGLLKAGDSVRIRPKSRADIMDMALDGREAIIEAIEQDAEDKVHLALVIADDPGRDLGMLRQPGHRFFYTLEEVEPLSP